MPIISDCSVVTMMDFLNQPQNQLTFFRLLTISYGHQSGAFEGGLMILILLGGNEMESILYGNHL